MVEKCPPEADAPVAQRNLWFPLHDSYSFGHCLVGDNVILLEVAWMIIKR